MTGEKKIAPFRGSFFGKDVISVEQFTDRKEIEDLFKIATKMKRSVEGRKERDDLKGFCIAELFYQPSTRTFTSFLAAAQRLGATYIIPLQEMTNTSVAKGESLPDTIRTIEETTAADLIVLRHPEDDSAEKAAAAARVPIISAGSGKREHPTQAILDLYTLKENFHELAGLKVTMVGDLKNGRTIKSFSKLLALVSRKVKLSFVSPKSLRAPAELIDYLQEKKIEVEETDSLEEILPQTDVLYVTRIQKEWFASEEEYQKVKGSYVINAELMRKAKKKMIVMHPLPRNDEIDTNFDSDPRAAYFKQMRNGLYTRMALLAAVLRKTA